MKPRIYADFQKINSEGLLILSTQGSSRDLAMIPSLSDGVSVVFYSDDEDDYGNPDELEVEGKLRYDQKNGTWLGSFNPAEIRHASDRR